MTHQGFFDLQTVQDLFKKLEHDLVRLKEERSNQYRAFNFFVTAEHMVDWLEYAGNGKKIDRKSDPLLATCSHIANGAKHFKLKDKKHKSVSKTELVEPFQADTFQDDLVDSHLVVILNGAAKALGNEIEVIDLAEKLLSFWKQELSIP